jgi:hypothetical protein
MLKRSTSMSIYYTYLLKHIPTNTFYYGVRFAEGCHPDEFWKTYFTSSKKKIPELREQYGDDSFEFEIRRTFTNKQKAIEWESKVLRRMRVLEYPKIWLNRTDNKAILNEISPTLGRVLNEKQKNAIAEANKKRIISDETREKLKARPRTQGFSGKSHSEESRFKIKKSLEGRIPWNKGKKGVKTSNKGQAAWNKGIKREMCNG